MNIYTCQGFEGHNPIGTSAVVVARDKGHARRVLGRQLLGHGLTLSGDETFTKVDVETAQAVILSDGEY